MRFLFAEEETMADYVVRLEAPWISWTGPVFTSKDAYTIVWPETHVPLIEVLW